MKHIRPARPVQAVIAALFCLGASSSLLAAASGKDDSLLEPPVVNTRPGPEYQDNVRAGAMIIGMDRTPRGRIWGCWSGTGDNIESYFILATSDDGGATWSKPRVVIDPQEIPGKPPRHAIIGNLWTDPSGRLWLFFDQQTKGGIATDWYVTCDNPDAIEPVWSQPVFFADGSTLNKPTILRSGEWLLPVSLMVEGRTSPPGAHVYVSTDRGKSWVRRGGVRVPDADLNHNEHMIVELRDGRLWMLLRTRYGIAETYSADAGRTWTELKKSPIENPSTRFFLRRLASDRLLLVKNGPIEKRLPGRSHLTAFLSDDEGKTWRGGLLLDDRNALSYPDGFQSPDGLIRILYDWNRHTDAEVLLTAFREEDVLAGKWVSPDAKPPFTVDKARAPNFSPSNTPDRTRLAQTTADAKLDAMSVAFDGTAANQLVTDTLLRARPDGSWALYIMAGAIAESKSLGFTGVAHSTDKGKTWTAPMSFDAGLPRTGDTALRGPAEIAIAGDRATLFFSTHANNVTDHWRTWLAHGDARLEKWSAPAVLPGRLADRTALRNPLVTRDGRILVPFQHYDGALDEPRCGILASRNGGETWTEHGNIRLTPVRRNFDWTEGNLVELAGGRIVMLVRQAGLMGLLYVAESADGGKTWPETARLMRAPTGGTTTLFSLGGDTVAMLHNPNTKLALWVSFDGMKTWPYQRALQATSCGGPKEAMNHPHGFLSADKQWIHFAFDDNRHRAVCYSAKLPPLK